MVIKWSRRARADIRDLKAYIAKDSPYYARRFTERIIVSVEKLVDFPKMGRPVPEAEGREDVRELIYSGLPDHLPDPAWSSLHHYHHPWQHGLGR